MKKSVLNWLMKFGWPIIKYVLINYGRQIAYFVSTKIKERFKIKKAQKMEDALNKAHHNEENAKNASSSEESLKFYEIAKAYKEEAEFHRKSMDEFEREIEKIIDSVMDDVVNKSKQIEFDHVFKIEGKKLKASDKNMLVEETENKETKTK